MVFANFQDLIVIVLFFSIGIFLGWKAKSMHIRYKQWNWWRKPKQNIPADGSDLGN